MNHGGANGKSLMARGHKALAINWGHLLLGAGLVICRIPVSHQSPSTVICAKSQWVRRTITRYRGFTRMIYLCWTWVSSQQSFCHARHCWFVLWCIQSLYLVQVSTRRIVTGHAYCAWLIKWVVKREIIQLTELCLRRWWIISGTWWYWVTPMPDTLTEGK